MAFSFSSSSSTANKKFTDDSSISDISDLQSSASKTQQSPNYELKGTDRNHNGGSAEVRPGSFDTLSLVSPRPTYQPVNYLHLCGDMKKLCPSFPFIWQKRFMILKPDGFMYYYYNENDFRTGAASRGVICIADIRTDLPSNGVVVANNRLNISVHSKRRRTYHLMFGSHEEANKWERAIRQALECDTRMEA